MADSLALLVLGMLFSLQAQTTSITVSGHVVSGAEKEKRGVADAVISSSTGTGQTLSASDGAFALPLPLGTARLTIEARGFVTQAIDLNVTPGMPALEILLVENTSFKEEIVVSGASRKDPTGVTVQPSAVLNVAGSNDNVFRALQTLPGVSAADDFGSRLTVRGGAPDQNLTVMDGIEIHNPYRLFGLTSAFNPETIDQFELTTGGFGVAHGDRLSSILLVDNRAGTTRKRFAGSASLSFTDANVVVEGRIPGTRSSSWLLTGRRTYYDLFAERFVHMSLPSFNDTQFRTVLEPKSGHKITVLGLRSREFTNLTLSGHHDNDHLGDQARNDLGAVAYEALFGRRATARTTVAWYRYADKLSLDASYLNPAQRSNTPNGFARTTFNYTRDLLVHDRSMRQEIRIVVGSRHTLDLGAEVHLLRTAWGWDLEGDRNPNAATSTSVLGGSALPSHLQSRRETTRGAVWVQDRVQVTPRVQLEPGVRVDRIDERGRNDRARRFNARTGRDQFIAVGPAADITVSPRFRARFDLTANTSVRTAIGLFTQSPGYEKVLQADNFVDLTDPGALNLRPEQAVHIVGALEHRFGHGILGRVEGYVKNYGRLVIGRLETPAETAARVAQYNFPPALAAYVPRTPQVTAVPSNGATGRARGIDLYLERRGQSAQDRLSGWASYTWGRADIEAYGQRYPFDYDRRHAASVVGTIRVLSHVDVSVTARAASGFARTSPVGVRVGSELRNGAVPGAPGSLVPARDNAGHPIWTLDFGDVSNINRGRLPKYTRVDLRVSLRSRSTTGRWLVYLEVLNLLNRRNVSQLEPELLYNPDSDRPALSFDTNTGLPRLPSFGLRYRF